MIDKRPIEDFNFSQEEYDRYQSGEEVWKDIEGFEGMYEISTRGQIRSIPRMTTNGSEYFIDKYTVLKQWINCNGYYSIALYKKNKAYRFGTHRLEGLTFLKNPLNKSDVNHIKGIKTLNMLDGLEWNTRSENLLHAFKMGLSKHTSLFSKDHRGSKPVNQLTKDGTFIKRWDCAADAWRELGINFRNISRCALGDRKTACGFVWEFAID
jgi:hypothetical protein